MYNGVNDENNQGAFNDENSLYHYSYSRDREPQPGQPDPSQTSWQPASQPEDPVSPEEPVAYTTGTRQDDSQPPKPEKGSFWKKTGTKVTALVLCCALIGGLCGFGGASLARRGGKATIQESGRTASAASSHQVAWPEFATWYSPGARRLTSWSVACARSFAYVGEPI